MSQQEERVVPSYYF